MTMMVAFSVAALPVAAIYLAPTLGVTLTSAAVLTAAYGVGNLAGSGGVMLRPLRLSPDHAMAKYAAFLAVALALVAVSKSFYFASVTYFLSGVVNAYFFAATLAARTEYSPAEGKGQVYLWVGALKIAAASQEQSAGIEQVNQSVMQMDETTQQNAALVEEATAAARSMEEQASDLAETVSVFRTNAVTPTPLTLPTAKSANNARSAHSPALNTALRVRLVDLALQSASRDWQAP